jgi:hypothetical protein
MNNIHNQSIPQEVLDKAIAKINEAGAILKPYLLTLTSTERSDMLKMGDKSSAFVQKALEYSKTNPEFAPGYLNLDDFDIDFADSQNLISALNTVTQLTNGIDDTKMVAGSESLQAALLYYGGVQKAVDMNIPGAKAIYEELKLRFPVRTKKAIAPAV